LKIFNIFVSIYDVRTFYRGSGTFILQFTKAPKVRFFKMQSKKQDENKTPCHYSLIKIILFFHGKNGFSWGTPLRAKMAHVIITLVEKKDISKMSKTGQAKHTFQTSKNESRFHSVIQ
jgi:hypothetical protein